MKFIIRYWSSTEKSDSHAWYVYLQFGDAYSNNKSDVDYVRCVRSENTQPQRLTQK